MPVQNPPVENESVEDESVEDEPVEDEPVEDEPVENEPVENEPVEKVATRMPAGFGSALGDLGMATAEYAIATLAACGFAGLLLTLLKSGEVKNLLLGIVRHALSV